MALGYREHAQELGAKNVVVYGMSDKDAQKNKEWVEKQRLPFIVLLDTDRQVGIAYGMSEAGAERYVANAAKGRRPAVVIDEQGRIAAWEPDMNKVEQIASLLASL